MNDADRWNLGDHMKERENMRKLVPRSFLARHHLTQVAGTAARANDLAIGGDAHLA